MHRCFSARAHRRSPAVARAEAITPAPELIRELAERTSNGTQMRLLWRQGTRELWVEISEPELDVTLVIPAAPDRALETFRHP
jgi:hypothetical protein